MKRFLLPLALACAAAWLAASLISLPSFPGF